MWSPSLSHSCLSFSFSLMYELQMGNKANRSSSCISLQVHSYQAKEAFFTRLDDNALRDCGQTKKVILCDLSCRSRTKSKQMLLQRANTKVTCAFVGTQRYIHAHKCSFSYLAYATGEYTSSVTVCSFEYRTQSLSGFRLAKLVTFGFSGIRLCLHLRSNSVHCE